MIYCSYFRFGLLIDSRLATIQNRRIVRLGEMIPNKTDRTLTRTNVGKKEGEAHQREGGIFSWLLDHRLLLEPQ